jgi:hypothetical protein
MTDIVSAAADRSRSRDLPPYRAVLVVDAKSFSDSPSFQQGELNTEIELVVVSAFARAGLSRAWRDRRFPGHTGDGYIVGLKPEHLPYLIDPLLREFQLALRERDHRRLAGQPRLRLRASVHVGPLPDKGLSNDGVGKPMTDTHRLLDSDQVRELLDRTHEDVTFVAAIISHRAYEDAVEGGYTGLHPAEFVRVEATAKRFAERAYLHVPQPSGAVLASGIANRGAEPSDRPERASAPRAPDDGTRIQTGGINFGGPTTIHGGEQTGGDRYGDDRR